MRKLTLHAALIGALLLVFGAGSYAVAHGGKRHIKSERHDRIPGGACQSRASPKGSSRPKIDDAKDTIHYTLTYEGLEAPVTQAHIHFGQRQRERRDLGLAVREDANPSPVGQHSDLPGRAAR